MLYVVGDGYDGELNWTWAGKENRKVGRGRISKWVGPLFCMAEAFVGSRRGGVILFYTRAGRMNSP